MKITGRGAKKERKSSSRKKGNGDGKEETKGDRLGWKGGHETGVEARRNDVK